jgi:hypothetical protein
MASIDEMLFDALRRSNPIGRVIEDFKRAQPALQAASTAPTGAAEALIGKLMVSPAFRTSATEEEARRRALEQDDLFVQALLGFEQAQGNPIQRAMASKDCIFAARPAPMRPRPREPRPKPLPVETPRPPLPRLKPSPAKSFRNTTTGLYVIYGTVYTLRG